MFSLKLFTKFCSKQGRKLFEENKQTFFYGEGRRIFNEGEPVKGIYFVEKGMVKVVSRAFDKSEKIVRLASNQMILGHRGLNTRIYPISAEALTEVVVTFLPIEVFNAIIRTNSKMAIYLINFLSDELRDVEIKMKNLLILDPKIRIAIILVDLINSFGYKKGTDGLLTFTLSRTDIANMGGTTYETVIRTLAYFKKCKIIRLDGKEIVILDEKKLRKIASGNESG